VSLTPYTVPRGSIHDLEHIATLSDEACILLCVSERTLYILQNLAVLDVTFSARYATELLDGGFVPVVDGDPLWPLFEETVERFQVEVIDMSCTILEYLQAIADAINSSGLGSGWEEVYDVPGYEDAPYYDPPGTDASPPVPSVKCELAWSFASNWSTAMIELLSQRNSLGVGLGVGAIALIVGLISVPVAAIVSILVALVGLVLVADIEITKNVISGLEESIACAIYSASSVDAAKTACDTVIDDAPQMNDRTRGILKDGISRNALNQIWEETYPPVSGVPTDCGGCGAAACPRMEFQPDGDGDPAGSGDLTADGELRTLTSAYDNSVGFHRLMIRSALACACHDFTIELVALNGYTAGPGDGIIRNCAGETLWFYDTGPNPPPMGVYLAKDTILASATGFTLDVRITE